MNLNLYTQCELTKQAAKQIAYIPDRFAVIDRMLKIRINGLWGTDWLRCGARMRISGEQTRALLACRNDHSRLLPIN